MICLEFKAKSTQQARPRNSQALRLSEVATHRTPVGQPSEALEYPPPTAPLVRPLRVNL